MHTIRVARPGPDGHTAADVSTDRRGPAVSVPLTVPVAGSSRGTSRPAAPREEGDLARIAAAIAWLDAHAVEQPRLPDVAAALHLSPGHLQRTFSRFAGTSPTRFLRWLTAGAARELLRERVSVLATTTAVGLSSPGRLHDLLVTLDGMTPGEVAAGGAGTALRYGIHDTDLGPVVIAASARGVSALRFVDDATEVRAELAADWPAAELAEDPLATEEAADAVRAALAGASTRTPLRLAVTGTNLQLKVWEALLRIPDDRVTTYGELARAVDRPTAVRAVASAVGRNPVAWLIPCHRVLRATGELGGYRWGPVRKRALLAREAARADDLAREV
jgi:AraC family transcriptional regulator, regulatory protein of adaptative response / methylated-DNA-[protein]-cysteine methyltransferase